MHSAPQSTGRKGGLTLSDGLASLVSGLGTSSDKNFANRYGLDARFANSYQDAEAAYRTSWIVRKAHDLPPFDMTRNWRNWQADKGQIADIEAEERRLGLQSKVKVALGYARLFGGGALILGAKQGRPEEPLALDGITKGGLQYVHAVTRHQLAFEDLDLNSLSPTFGQPKMWMMSGGSDSVRIHPTRVIPFIGQPIPKGIIGTGEFWGDPLLTSIWEAVTNADMVQSGIAALMQEAKTDTLSIPDFASKVATAEYERIFMRRVELANMIKSLLNTRIIDADEKWDTRQLTFTGLTDIEQSKLQIVAAAVDIPISRFLGQSAKGLNATGQGDEDNYNAMIAAKQANELQPVLAPILDEVLIRSALGVRPEEVRYVWAPLSVAEPKEAAEIEKLEAETAEIYAAQNLVPADALAKAVQNRMMESGRWPGLEQAIEEAEAELELDPVEEDDPSALAEDPESDPVAAMDAAPRTLYVSRKLLNAEELIRWAKSQGFRTTQKPEDMHVTVAFSRTPLDWMAVGTDWSGDEKGHLRVPAGGPRVVEPIGDKGAVALQFVNESLAWRHERIINAGASWDWPSYQPHVTITWDVGDLDLSQVEPYTGPLVFGPEIFAEVVEDWEKTIKED